MENDNLDIYLRENFRDQYAVKVAENSDEIADQVEKLFRNGDCDLGNVSKFYWNPESGEVEAYPYNAYGYPFFFEYNPFLVRENFTTIRDRVKSEISAFYTDAVYLDFDIENINKNTWN